MATPVMQQAQMEAYANQLEATLPPPGVATEVAAAAPGGLIGAVLALVAALRAGDWAATIKAVFDLLDLLRPADDGTISFQQPAIAAGFDWKQLIAVLLKLLPVILGA